MVGGERTPAESLPDGGIAPAPSPSELGLEDAPEQDLAQQVSSGAKWSMVGNIISRAGTFLVGIVVANLVSPDQLGVFSIAMMVGQMALTFADMGLGADLVRSDDEQLAHKIPTTATLGLLFCGLGALVLVALAHPIANGLNVPDSAALIQVYSIMVLLAGFSVVPLAILQRNIDQKHLFVLTVTEFLISNGLSLGLLATGMGVLALPIGGVVAQFIQIVMMHFFARWKPNYGLDRALVRPVLGFGIPVGGSNLLQVLLGNVDRVVVAPLAGGTALGNYTLASNISNWPVSVLGLVVRSIALPAFAKSGRRKDDPSLTLGVSITWMASLPIGVMLAVMSHQVIYFLYGAKYSPAVSLLAIIGMYGAIRVMFDVFTGYLFARGDSRGVLWANLGWTAALFVITWVFTKTWGTHGAASAQIVTALLVAMPLFLWSVRRCGGHLGNVVGAMLPAVLACIPASVVVWLVLDAIEHLHLFGNVRLDAFVELAVGGILFLALYVPFVLKRFRAQVATMRAEAAEEDDETDDQALAPTAGTVPATATPDADKAPATANRAGEAAAARGATAATRPGATVTPQRAAEPLDTSDDERRIYPERASWQE